MAVGKPDFDLNSFGIQYKEKRVKYFRKGDNDLSDDDFTNNQDNISTVSGTVKPQTPEDLATAKLNTSLNTQSVNAGTGASIGAGASAKRRARNAAQPAVKPAVKPAPKPKEVKPKHTKDTKYVFNAEQDPKTLSHYQSQLLEDVNESRPKNPKPDPITGITPEKRRDYPTQGVIANSANVRSGGEGGKTEDITEVPDPKKRGGSQKELMNVGRTRPEGYTEPAKDKEERKRLSDKEKPDEKKEKEVKEKETRETKDIPKKMGSRMVGNAPEEIPKKNTTEQSHSGKKVTVGVGSKAKEVFDKREGVGAVHDESESKTRPTGVVDKPDKELNTITSTENKRLRDHNTEMEKFLKGATDAQRREYTAIADREDGREDHDAQRAYVRNITGKQSKTQEKITQTKEEKEDERKQDHADRMTDMKERADRIESDAEKEKPPVGSTNTNEFYGNPDSTGKINPKDGTEVSTITGTNRKETVTGKKDNPNSSKAPEEETEPKKITTDNKDDKISAIATQLAQIKDPKKRAERRAELSGQNEADKSKKEIEAAAKKVEAAKKKIEAAKKKKETSKKKKVVPKEGQLTPAQIKAYKKERESKKDVVAKSNDIIMDTIIMKLDLMKARKLNNSPLESVSRLTPKQRKIEADKFRVDPNTYTPKQRKAAERGAWEQKDRQNKETQEMYDNQIKTSISEIDAMTDGMKDLLKIKDPLANRKRKIRAQGYESAADYDKYQDAGNTYSDLDEDSHARQEQ